MINLLAIFRNMDNVINLFLGKYSVCVCVCVCVQLFPTLCDLMDCSLLGSLRFSRQEYWSGLPFPTPGDLPDPTIEPTSLGFPAAWAGRFLTAVPPGKPRVFYIKSLKIIQHCDSLRTKTTFQT